MTEKKAIALCIAHKDPVGFDFLVRQFRREAYFHAVGFLGNSEDAADACQDAFTKAFRAMPLLKELDRFYPWFYRILKNHCLNMLDRRKTVQNNVATVLGDQDYSRFDSDILLEKTEQARCIWRALGKLNPEFREILVLKYIREMDYTEIAQRLGIVRGTVMSRLYHARKSFKQVYEHCTGSKKEERYYDNV